MRVLGLADEFGYGPVALLQRAIEHLPLGTFVDLFVSDAQAKLIQAPEGIEIRFHGPDVLPSDLTGLDAALLAGGYDYAVRLLEWVPTVLIIDQLFWFWSSIPRAVHLGAHVLAQDFFGVRARAKAHRNVHVVGPIVPQPPEASGPPYYDLLINLGGFKSPYHDVSHAAAYAEMLGPLIRSARAAGLRLFVAGGPMVVDSFRDAYPELMHVTGTVCHSEMLNLIRTAGLYCTVPGLGSIYEPLLLNTPTLFLPPVNLTQAMQVTAVSQHLSYPWLIPPPEELIPPAATELDEERLIPRLFQHYSRKPPLSSNDARWLVESFLGSSGKLSSREQSHINGFLDEMGQFGDQSFGQKLRDCLNA